MFKIKTIRNVDWGTNSIARASMDVEVLPHGIILKDCLLKEGQFGWFVSSPSKKLKEPWTNDEGKTFEYMDMIFFPKTIRDELNNIACAAYDPSGVYTTDTTTETHPLTEKVADINADLAGIK